MRSIIAFIADLVPWAKRRRPINRLVCIGMTIETTRGALDHADANFIPYTIETEIAPMTPTERLTTDATYIIPLAIDADRVIDVMQSESQQSRVVSSDDLLSIQAMICDVTDELSCTYVDLENDKTFTVRRSSVVLGLRAMYDSERAEFANLLDSNGAVDRNTYDALVECICYGKRP